MRAALTALLTLADEKLRAAGLLVAGGAWGDASSRAYYAAFHAVSAALLSRGETYSRHGQVLGAFNRAFVHTGLFPKELHVRMLAVRKAIGDNGTTARLLRTVRGRGYRFVAPWQQRPLPCPRWPAHRR